MARRPSFYFFLAVLLNVFLFAYPAHSQEGKIVRSLKIEGNKRVDDSTILYYVKTKIGEPLSRALIRRDIEQINSLGQFKNIRVETQTTSKGLEVIFVVEEIPSIGNVKITGNDVVDTQDIRDRITIKRGTTFHEHLVRETTGEIQLLYHDKGYFFVAVKIDTQASGNQVDVRIKIVEGEKVGIKRIRFIGNKTFKDKALLGEMETKKKSWISFLDDSGIYKKDVLKVDLLRVESFYHDHGFIRVRVLEPKIDVDRKSKKIYITIPVEEGARYRTGKINIEGDDTFTSEELRIAMKTREGDVYNVSQLRNDVLAITELYSGKGYAYADVTPNTTLDDKARKVDLSISAEKGR
ncbi:MAG: POTRA domain-containing protein, partial [Nitrospinales bacterium]